MVRGGGDGAESVMVLTTNSPVNGTDETLTAASPASCPRRHHGPGRNRAEGAAALLPRSEDHRDRGVADPAQSAIANRAVSTGAWKERLCGPLGARRFTAGDPRPRRRESRVSQLLPPLWRDARMRVRKRITVRLPLSPYLQEHR